MKTNENNITITKRLSREIHRYGNNRSWNTEGKKQSFPPL